MTESGQLDVTTIEEAARGETNVLALKTIPVAEIFGPTLQGEGALAGRPTYFLRVGGCDFSCVWCDSSHAVLVNEVRGLPRMNVGDIVAAIFAHADKYPGPDWLTISGGNPGLYDLHTVVEAWQNSYSRPAEFRFRHTSGRRKKVAVETQGTRWQPWFGKVNLLTVSPKPPSSMMTNTNFEYFMARVVDAVEIRSQDERIPEDNWQMVLKVVVFDEDDYQFARKLHIRWPLIPFYLSCGTAMGGLSGRWTPPTYGGDIMTMGPVIDNKEILLARYRWLAERMMNDPVMANVVGLPQLHALLFGITTRGV